MKKILLLIILSLIFTITFAGYFDYDTITPGCSIEICDGVDNDCDDLIDELIEKSCTTGSGASTCSGIQRCNYGLWTFCDVSTAQTVPETCNNLDDDCDIYIDELWPSKGNACGNCGEYICNSTEDGLTCGNEGICLVDQKETTQCGTSNVGECKLGNKEKICSSQCAWENWSTCQGNIEPETEICDGLDNDCDGITDEGCNCTPPGSQISCGTDTGECQKGTLICSAGSWGNCTGEIAQVTEICDGLDNDCDGITDEGCNCTPPSSTRSCGVEIGECTKGTQTCETGNWGACIGGITRITEICDNKDNDCDGEVDEGCDCATGDTKACGLDTGECAKGLQNCVNGKWESCTGETNPTTETCDNKDNDCDGDIDEELSKFCGETDVGTCSFGNQLCVNGNWGDCTGEIKSVNEQCEGILDEDCDGDIDNGCICSEGQEQLCGKNIGECVAGKKVCSNNAWGTCVGGAVAVIEICDNGLDDDCDGIIDNGCVINQTNELTGVVGQDQNEPFSNPASQENSFYNNAFDNGENYDSFLNPENPNEPTSPQNQENGGTNESGVPRKINIHSNKYSGQTTNLENITNIEITNFTLEKINEGKVVFEKVLFEKDVNLDKYTRITKNSIFINSGGLPELNKKAKITFYDVNLINPIILKDGFPCTSNECKLISKDNNTIEFEVEHFTTYSVGSLNDYICRNGYSGTPCFCGPDIISENYCCKGVIKVDSCEDDYFSSEPPVVFNCSKDLEGECVIIGNMTGTCIDGNLEEGCISKQVSSWDGINKLINENLSVFFIILGLFGLFIILLILNKVLFLNKEKKKELTKTKYQKSENMVIQDILSNVDQKDKKFTKDELLEQLRSDLKSNKK